MIKKLSVSWILCFSLVAGISSSCVESNNGTHVQGDLKTMTLQGMIDSILFKIHGIESDASRGLILQSMREAERMELEDILYEIRLALHRLHRHLDDTQASERLDFFTHSLLSQTFPNADQTRINRLTSKLKELLDELGQVYQRELFNFVFKGEFGDFRHVTTVGTTSWELDPERGVARATGFRRGVSEAWLISPVFDFSEAQLPYLQLRQTTAFVGSLDHLEVLVSTNYSGGHPDAASWDALWINRLPRTDVNWDSMTSEKIDLSAYEGQQLVVAFRYRSTASVAATWQIDSISLGAAGIRKLLTKPVTPSLELNEPSPDVSSKVLLESDFANSLEPFRFQRMTGSISWRIDPNRPVASVSGFRQGANETWLLSPEIDLSEALTASVQIEQAVAFLENHDDVQVFVATDYSGDLESANWQMLHIEKKPSGERNWESVMSEAVSLEEYIGGSIVLGFRYKSSADQASTWQLSKVVLRASFKE